MGDNLVPNRLSIASHGSLLQFPGKSGGDRGLPVGLDFLLCRFKDKLSEKIGTNASAWARFGRARHGNNRGNAKSGGGGAMEQIIRQIVRLLGQGIETILKFLQLIWTWSFGQIITIFQSNWQALPVWKIAVLAIAILGIAYFLYRAFRQIWAAVLSIFKAFVELLTAFVSVLPLIIASGAIAFLAGWVVKAINP
jgi:hypothetical protein